jgi:hypothetical protein
VRSPAILSPLHAVPLTRSYRLTSSQFSPLRKRLRKPDTGTTMPTKPLNEVPLVVPLSQNEPLCVSLSTAEHPTCARCSLPLSHPIVKERCALILAQTSHRCLTTFPSPLRPLWCLHVTKCIFWAVPTWLRIPLLSRVNGMKTQDVYMPRLFACLPT